MTVGTTPSRILGFLLAVGLLGAVAGCNTPIKPESISSEMWRALAALAAA